MQRVDVYIYMLTQISTHNNLWILHEKFSVFENKKSKCIACQLKTNHLLHMSNNDDRIKLFLTNSIKHYLLDYKKQFVENFIAMVIFDVLTKKLKYILAHNLYITVKLKMSIAFPSIKKNYW